MTTLPADLLIFLRSGSRIQPEMSGVLERQGVVLEVAAHDRREQPGADDLVGLGAQVHREDPVEEVGAPVAGDLGRERARGPGVHDVGVADEATGLVALRLDVAGRHVARRVDRQRRRASARIGRVEVDLCRWRRAGTRRGTARRRSAGARCSSRRLRPSTHDRKRWRMKSGCQRSSSPRASSSCAVLEGLDEPLA